MKSEFYIVYETTNLINGKKYRGIHKTSNLDDGYLGSGLIFRLSVEKYGKHNFIRNILEFCNSYDELIEREKYYVDENWIKDKSNYNLKTGGQSAGILSDESKNKISETLKRKYQNGEIIPVRPNKGISPTDEIKKKISETLKEKYNNEEHPSKGKTRSSATWVEGNIPWNKGLKTGPQDEELKMKKSKSLKKFYSEHPNHLKNRIPWNRGKKGLQKGWNKGLKMKQVICPHCDKIVDIGNGKRWHFDNCKKKKST